MHTQLSFCMALCAVHAHDSEQGNEGKKNEKKVGKKKQFIQQVGEIYAGDTDA